MCYCCTATHRSCYTLQHNDGSFMSRHVSLSVHPHHHPSAHTNADKTPIDSCTVRAAAGRAHVGAAAARADAHPCTGTSCCCSADACCCSCLRCHCLLDGRLAVLDAGDGCSRGTDTEEGAQHIQTTSKKCQNTSSQQPQVNTLATCRKCHSRLSWLLVGTSSTRTQCNQSPPCEPVTHRPCSWGC